VPERADVIVCGVGGQGILLLAELLGTAALKSGLDVRVSEIHGMAQRGGSVICHVRVGRHVRAPTVLDGRADILVALEPVEALRAIRYLGPQSLALVSTRPIRPVMVSLGMATYPDLEQVRSALEAAAGRVIFVDALGLAEEAGNPITQNMVMAGALCATGAFPARREAMLEAMRELVPARYLEVNLRAFELGERAVRELGH